MLKEIHATSDPEKRLAMYREVAKKVYSEALTVFLVHETIYDAYSAKVKNYKPHPLNYYMLTPELSIN